MLDNRIKTDETVIWASHIIIKPMLMPTRVVLRKVEENKWVTHHERLRGVTPDDDVSFSCAFVHHSYDHGNYFDTFSYGGDVEKTRKAAEDDFNDRVAEFRRS